MDARPENEVEDEPKSFHELKKKQKVLELVDVLLRKYKEHGIELQKLIRFEKTLMARNLPSEVTSSQ